MVLVGGDGGEGAGGAVDGGEDDAASLAESAFCGVSDEPGEEGGEAGGASVRLEGLVCLGR